MDTMSAFAKGEATRGQPFKVFDWDQAARIILQEKPEYAVAGLAGDMEWTAGPIWLDGKPVPPDKTYTYLASTWATPVLEIDDRQIPCWCWEEGSGWDEKTYWPPSALAILAVPESELILWAKNRPSL